MEQNFQTSFIPKKPVVNERVKAGQPIGPLVVIALFLLFTALIASGGLYFYKELREKNIVDMQEGLELAQNRFERSLIEDLQELDKRLRAGSAILAAHIAVTPIFDALEEVTMKTVRFTTFDYTRDTDATTPVTITMLGEAVGYRPIALQSDLLAQNKNFINPVFSNLTLNSQGNVTFSLQFGVDPALLNYKKTLATENQ